MKKKKDKLISELEDEELYAKDLASMYSASCDSENELEPAADGYTENINGSGSDAEFRQDSSDIVSGDNAVVFFFDEQI